MMDSQAEEPPGAAPVTESHRVPCGNPRCGQPVPGDAQPHDRCITCGQKIRVRA